MKRPCYCCGTPTGLALIETALCLECWKKIMTEPTNLSVREAMFRDRSLHYGTRLRKLLAHVDIHL